MSDNGFAVRIVPYVEAINLHRRLARLSTGVIVPIVYLQDLEGRETEDLDEAIVAICGSSEHGWYTAGIADFESARASRH